MTAPRPALDLAALRALREQATPGEWRVDEQGGDAEPLIRANDVEVALVIDDERKTVQGLVDAHLIASLHNAVPALLDAAERLEKVRAMKPELFAMRHQLSYGSPAKIDLDRLLALLGDGHE